MTTPQLLKLFSDPSKEEFIKNYYDSVWEGLKESNAYFGKFFLYLCLIIVFYYAFDIKLIMKISIGQIDIENIQLLRVATPLISTFCYFLMSSNMTRYMELRIQYDAISFYFTKDASFKDGETIFHTPILPANSIFSTLNYLFQYQTLQQFAYGCLLSIPLFGFLFFILYFNIVTIWRLPFRELTLVSSAIAVISCYLLLITFKITLAGNNNNDKDRKLLNEFIDSYVSEP